jgi:tRNA-dihydrouridine synthase
VFRRIERALAGLPPLAVDLRERERVLLGWFATVREEFGADLPALGRFKKIAKYFCDGVAGGEELKRALLRSATAEEAVGHARAFFDRSLEPGEQEHAA